MKQRAGLWAGHCWKHRRANLLEMMIGLIPVVHSTWKNSPIGFYRFLFNLMKENLLLKALPREKRILFSWMESDARALV